MGGNGLEGSLMSAVRAGDAETVRALLEQGADANTANTADGADADGLPVLCVAVAAYDEPVAAALVEGGADPDRVLPDGTTPLWRAVDGGSPAVFSAVLGDEPRLRLSEADRERLLALARGWYGTGAAEELRRRTGAPDRAGRDSAATVLVQDGEYNHVDQVSLGGLVVRAGHGAILTSLEWAFRILTPVDELIARAVGQPPEDRAVVDRVTQDPAAEAPFAEEHVNWSTVCWILSRRRSFETWSAVVAHRHHPAPAHRRFVLDYLRTRSLTGVGSGYYKKKESEVLAAWAAEETDGETLARVLDVFTEYEHPGQEAIGLRHAGHPDARVRREVPYALTRYEVARSPAARAAILALTRDPDAAVRISACTASLRDEELLPEIIQALILLAEDTESGRRGAAATLLAESGDRTPAVADALAALLDDGSQLVRLEAAHGLLLRDDPRTAEAIERVGPLDAGFEHDHRADALRQWMWRRENPTAG
ncbi:HEAT repeat domain-containing protein [Streptomyces sp. NBC_01433]|uniref:ankyrin repeat domain-containing protein n=1 Tax=Streptomyces sp. NBC_01433 TaxID=2903864 RepID=UPI00224EE47A|nr:HEAT repeat domain-containing protein [Streptomyces sp. NBC_01433]MCX4677107.1 HEAT repeat domain-containing protein [Streptomyces sp. NBC_01433]